MFEKYRGLYKDRGRKMSSKRIEWLDTAKGAGMLLVILGHALPYGGIICNLIFAFHMPLFFILSGIVYKDKPLKDVALKRIKTLLLPYILFVLLGTLITVLTGTLEIKGLVQDLYYGNPEHIYVSSVWFLVAMYGVNIAFALIRKIGKAAIQYVIIIGIFALGLIYGYLFYHKVLSFRLPLDFDVVPVALGFFALGYYIKSWVIEQSEKIRTMNSLQFIGAFSLLVIVFLGSAIINGTVNLHGISYHIQPLFFISALAGSSLIILVCVKLDGMKITKPFIYIGKNTIYLLGAQAIGIRFSVAIINRIFNKEFALYGLPYVYSVLAFIMTTVFSVMFTILIKAVWKCIHQPKELKSDKLNSIT